MISKLPDECSIYHAPDMLISISNLPSTYQNQGESAEGLC